MSGLIENERSLLEEMEAIELALSKRFRRNQNLVPAKVVSSSSITPAETNSKKRSHRETILQKHEVKFLLDRYRGNCDYIRKSRDDVDRLSVFEEELKNLDDPSHAFKHFDASLQSIKEQHELYRENSIGADSTPAKTVESIASGYSMFSSRPESDGSAVSGEYQAGGQPTKRAKRKFIMSKAASHITLSSLFTEAEDYGRSLDLNKFFAMYKTMIDSDQQISLTYKDYLLIYDKLPYSNAKVGSQMQKGNYESRYLPELLEYLESFTTRSRPFDEDDVFANLKQIKKSDKSEPITSSASTDGSVNEKGEIFCKACDKWFTKESVYKGHLPGKKHLKNAKKLNEALQNGSQEGLASSVLKDSTYLLEEKIKFLGNYLESERQNTIANIERMANITDRERMLERAALREEGEELTDISGNDDASNSESDDGDDDENDLNNFKNLPVGADGQPMPFWLYKLQGYHKSYDCEICGDVSYKGRVVFTKHFTGFKHQQGLKMLGINDESLPLFKNIIKIDEAIELWRRIKKGLRIKEGDTENAIEVEDSEGNVMSEKDYEELKRQGLL